MSTSLVAELEANIHISDVLEEMGYASCETSSVLKEVIGQFGELREKDVAYVLCT